MSRLPHLSLVALTLAAALGLAGCTGPSETTPSAGASADATTQGQQPTASASEPIDSSTPAPPAALVPNGTAAQNLPFFTQVVTSVWSGPDKVSGRAYIDALAAAGFDKAAMQVTADESTIGNAAESIEFSVRLGGECLVGQVGPSIGNPVTAAMPGLSEGKCLIGQTRSIDW